MQIWVRTSTWGSCGVQTQMSPYPSLSGKFSSLLECGKYHSFIKECSRNPRVEQYKTIKSLCAQRTDGKFEEVLSIGEVLLTQPLTSPSLSGGPGPCGLQLPALSTEKKKKK